MTLILSFDPGEVNTGFCLFRELGEGKVDLTTKGVFGQEELYAVLAMAEGLDNIEAVVFENFRVRPPSARGKSHHQMYSWNEIKTIRRIGSIEYFAHRVGARLVTQESRILSTGVKWCDLPMKYDSNGHLKDAVSAYIHGAWYMMQMGIIKSVNDIYKNGQAPLDGA